MTGIPAIKPFELPSETSLPENYVSWAVDASRSVLLIHDMQHYFLRAFPAGAEPRDTLVRNTAALRRQCADLGIPVAYTAQPGSMTAEQRGLLMDFWGPGMSRNDNDREIEESVAPVDGDWLLTKWRYSAFVRSDLLARMQEAGRDQIMLCGVYCHVGILATAVDALAHDIQAFVVADATADFSQEYHQMALTYIAERCGMVLTADTISRELEAVGTETRA